jgi:hypothetical protein
MNIKFKNYHVEKPSAHESRLQFMVTVVKSRKTTGATVWLLDFDKGEQVPLSLVFNYYDEAKNAMTEGFEVLPESIKRAEYLVNQGIAEILKN